jgi:hypothetical protein
MPNESIVDPEEALRRRDEGLSLVDEHTDPEVKEALFESILTLAQAPIFSTDCVWPLFDRDYPHLSIRQKKGLGNATLRALKEGICGKLIVHHSVISSRQRGSVQFYFSKQSAMDEPLVKKTLAGIDIPAHVIALEEARRARARHALNPCAATTLERERAYANFGRAYLDHIAG